MAGGSSETGDRRWAVLALLGVAQLMVVLDATIVNIALPSAQRALGFSTVSRQWVVTAYALAFGSLLLLGGKLGDLFGRKWTFIAGLIGFAVASAIGGLAQSFGMLVVARALQGAFGALLAPAALSLLTVTFAGSPDRSKAFGIFGAIAGGGASVGLVLGGVLTQALSWRWCLYVNLLIALPTVLVALRLLQNHPPEARPHIDIPGVLLACGGLFALVYGFSNAETHSWTTPLTIIALAASVVLLAAFVAVPRKTGALPWRQRPRSMTAQPWRRGSRRPSLRCWSRGPAAISASRCTSSTSPCWKAPREPKRPRPSRPRARRIRRDDSRSAILSSST
jgi:MFS family permease